jgi:serine/threonine protein kinase
MDRVLERTPDGTSPRTFALNHLRPKSSFQGCSRIADYELLGKLGEGTFGEVHRARSRKTGASVALKKIIMHHEKDGVGKLSPQSISTSANMPCLVSNHGAARNQASQVTITSKYPQAGRHGRRTSNKAKYVHQPGRTDQC